MPKSKLQKNEGSWNLTGSLSRADGTPFGSLLANGDVLVARVAFFTARPVPGPTRVPSLRFAKVLRRHFWERETYCSRDLG